MTVPSEDQAGTTTGISDTQQLMNANAILERLTTADSKKYL